MPTILAFGNSHLWPFVRGYRSLREKGEAPFTLRVLDFSGEEFHPHFRHDGTQAIFNPLIVEGIQAAIAEAAPDYIVTSVLGSDHWRSGMINNARPYDFLVPALPEHGATPGVELIPYDLINQRIRADMFWQFDLVRMVQTWCAAPMFHVEAPPPVENEALMLRSVYAHFKDAMEEFGCPDVSHRLKQWWCWSRNAREICAELGIRFIEGPPETRDAKGFLNEAHYLDGVHGSDAYGELIARELVKAIGYEGDRKARMTQHPYLALPDHQFWRKSIASVPPSEVDPVVRARFKIAKTDRVATAGSCFAQHIARHLTRAGFNYFVTETAHPMVAHLADDYNYGVFSARYGNLYTSRQLVQTLKRAYGLFTPADNAWRAADGRFIDPYRPQIQPSGFASLAELTEDRRMHFAAIRKLIEELDVFVFTLGLTETWVSRVDGAVYPLCPGVSGGVFDEGRHGFVNLSVGEVAADMTEAIALIRSRNPRARFVLTVSPVPLIATMEDRSVLASTTYSKSVLRVAAEMAAQTHEDVAYFPSYEVITGAFSRGAYFAGNLRDVTEEGVSHVMRLFMKHYAAEDNGGVVETGAETEQRARLLRAERLERDLKEVAAVICDEVALDPVRV